MSRFQEKNVDHSLGTALFTNLLLLGFDPYDATAKYKVKIDSESFKVPNHKAFQVVSHFLLLRFDPKKDAEIATCWPICSKKEERQFRSICYSYFRSLMESDPCANFPHFSASLFLSPGGPQFYLLYVAVSSYLLTRIIRQDYPEERLLPFQKNNTFVDTLLLNTVLEVNNWKNTSEAIKNVACSFQDHLHSQSAAYWKVSSAIQSFEKQMADEVISITGTISADRYYEEREKTEKDCATQLVLVHKGWEQVDILCLRTTAFNKKIKAAICCDEGGSTLDGSGANSGEILYLDKSLINFLTAIPPLQMILAKVPDAVMVYKTLSINENENVHQIEESFLHELKLHFSRLLSEEIFNEEYIHDGSCVLLQATPELNG